DLTLAGGLVGLGDEIQDLLAAGQAGVGATRHRILLGALTVRVIPIARTGRTCPAPPSGRCARRRPMASAAPTRKEIMMPESTAKPFIVGIGGTASPNSSTEQALAIALA